VVATDGLLKQESDRKTVSRYKYSISTSVKINIKNYFNVVLFFVQEDMSLNSSSEFPQQNGQGQMSIETEEEEEKVVKGTKAVVEKIQDDAIEIVGEDVNNDLL
jgi:hypothetical protein